jgi:Protein of unknown function, DUF600
MNPFERQTEILNYLVQIMHDEADGDYEKLTCRFEINLEEEWSETKFVFQRNGLEVSKGISEKYTWDIHNALEELHIAMREHTGGEWTSFTLTLDKDGKAHTKFHYPES